MRMSGAPRSTLRKVCVEGSGRTSCVLSIFPTRCVSADVLKVKGAFVMGPCDIMWGMDMAEEKAWRDTYRQVVALERGWEKPRFRMACIARLRQYLLNRCEGVAHLGDLVRLVRPEMTLQDLYALLVPCERVLKRIKVTDVEILSADRGDAAAVAERLPLTVVADHFRSAINVGTLFRVCDCFGVESAVLCGYTPSPDDGRAKQAALGAEAWVPWRRAGRTLEAVREEQARGRQVIALETVPSAVPLEAWTWRFPCSVVLGSERFGLDAEVVKACDAVMRIPMFGHKNSLNVVMAFTLVAHAARTAFQAAAQGHKAKKDEVV